MLPFLVLAAMHWPLAPLLSNSDYALYLMHAEALLHGRPYTDTGYIFSPFAPYAGPEAFPPGLPLSLVPLLAVFGRNFAVLKIFEIVSLLVFLWCAARYIERRSGIWIACGAAMMTGVALEQSFATNVVNSDVGFAALVWGLCLAADGEGEWTRRRVLAVLLLGAAAMAYRVIGVAAIPALTIYAFAHWRTSGRWALAPVGFFVACALVVASVLPIASQYRGPLPDMPANLIGIAVRNAVPLRFALLDGLLYPFPGDTANEIYHVVTLLLGALGAVIVVRKYRLNFLICFVVSYSTLLLVAPAAVTRYWWPLFPLFATCMLTGVDVIARQVAGKWRFAPVLPLVLAGLLAAGAVGVAATRPAPLTIEDHEDLNALFATVRNAPDAKSWRVYFATPTVMSLNTGASAMSVIGVPEADLLEQLRAHRITHIVTGDLAVGRRRAQRTLRSAIAHNPTMFVPIYRNDTFVLYQVVPH